MATLQAALARFGYVTVMDAYFFASGTTNFNVDGNGLPTLELFKLDTLRISNFTQEGPRKTAKGGLNAKTIFRYGKTARLEMEDVVGRIAALEALMGVREVTGATVDTAISETFQVLDLDQDELHLSYPISHLTVPVAPVVTRFSAAGVPTVLVVVTDYDAIIVGDQVIKLTATGDPTAIDDYYTVSYSYSKATVDSYQITEEFEPEYTIFGRTFVIDEATGDREYINIIIHSFLPDSLLNVTMESEGDFGVINFGGELFTNECGVFYEYTKGTNPAGCP